MKTLYAMAIVTFVGLTTGNFIWQIIMNYEWRVATERSFYQFVAISVLTGLLAYHRRNRNPIKSNM